MIAYTGERNTAKEMMLPIKTTIKRQKINIRVQMKICYITMQYACYLYKYI